jgi:hypothetical protein
MMEDRTNKLKTQSSFQHVAKPYKTVEEALEAFKTERANHIKYIKGTTEDLRNHVVQMSFGWIDCYQLCLVIACNSDRHMQQIQELKEDPNFPSR